MVSHFSGVRAVRPGEGGGATRARAAAPFFRMLWFRAKGRVAQRESACFTRKRSQVQTLHRPPPRSRSGGTADALRSGRSARNGRGGSNPPFGTNTRYRQGPTGPFSRARSSVRIERSPAEAEVVGSSPTERATPAFDCHGGRVAQRQSRGFISLVSRVRIPPLPPSI